MSEFVDNLFAAVHMLPTRAEIKPGDAIVTKSGKRAIVDAVDDNINGLVFVCTCIDSGRECIVLESEVA